MSQTFAVRWSAEALDQLAEVWLAARDRERINRAVRALDLILASDPQSKGFAVAEDLHRLQVDHLRAYFQVDLRVRTVEILGVRMVQNPRLN